MALEDDVAQFPQPHSPLSEVFGETGPRLAGRRLHVGCHHDALAQSGVSVALAGVSGPVPGMARAVSVHTPPRWAGAGAGAATARQ